MAMGLHWRARLHPPAAWRSWGAGGRVGVGWASGLWVPLPPSSSDLWGVCGRRRRLWKQEARENELLNVFKVQADGEVITVSVRGSALGLERDGVALTTGLFLCCSPSCCFLLPPLCFGHWRLHLHFYTGAKRSCQRCEPKPHFVSCF